MRPDRFPPYFFAVMLLFFLILFLLIFEGMETARNEKREHMQSPYDPFFISILPNDGLFLQNNTQRMDRHASG